MRTFLALYRGATIGEAELIAVTADPRLVGDVAHGLLYRYESLDDTEQFERANDRATRTALELALHESTAEATRPRGRY